MAHSMAPSSISIQMPGAGSASSISAPGQTVAPSAEDAERRKQVALKALNERLAKGGVGMSKTSPAPLIPLGKTSKGNVGVASSGAIASSGGTTGSKERLVDV
ncbi:transmembrane protein 115-like [Tropilaelaps mercedesae]|uniref:Transmembrane protein 115-like n=1 Tax=Tropilaelaps mercedesae TaxID=418985 RepID=A0A1V9XFP6_9ACAR|nr:transmembrane protein 115-like [Tropilaelaps mercedesae]